MDRNTVPRRFRLYAALALLTALALATAACGPAPAGTTPPGASSGTSGGQAGAPSAGGQFTMAIQSDPIMNPILGSDTSSIIVNKVLFNGLTRPDPVTQEPKPDLAESWDVSPDGLTWTFRLRSGVKWHDGQPFTAEDVKFTMDKTLDPKVNSRNRGNFAVIKRTEVVDPLTVKFHLSEPFAPLPTFLGYNAGIAPKHVLENVPDMNTHAAFNKQRPIGTGPFMIKEVRGGDHVTVVANPNFHFGKPKLDAINFKVIPDANQQTAQFKTGELTFVLVEPFNLKVVEGTPGTVIDEGNQINYWYLSLNKNNPLFQDRRVRQALTYGLNRKAIVDNIMRGKARLASHPLNPAIGWAFIPGKEFPYDPEKAKGLLAEAGWKPGPDGILTKDGKPFKFRLTTLKGNPTFEQVATLAQQDYQKLGIQVELEAAEFSTYIKDRRDNRFGPNASEALVHFWITPPDPDLYNYYHTSAGKAGFNTGVYANPAMDRLLEEGRKTADRTKRADIYRQVQELMVEDVPEVPLFYPVELRALNAKLKGFPKLGIRDALIYSYEWYFER